MEIWQRFTSDVRRAILAAHEAAVSRQRPAIGSAHIALALLSTCPPAVPPPEAAMAELERLAAEGPTGEGEGVSFTEEAQRALLQALRESGGSEGGPIAEAHVLMGLLREAPSVPRELAGCYDVPE
ncbi:MAG: hypothetical protein KKI08_16005 [Armatimonadetes bacterium]|nr:hypothetical protein [Armatimonadota bacterium]